MFGVRRSVRYHMRRAAFFDQWGQVTSGLNVLFGSTAIASALGALGADRAMVLSVAAGAVITIVSTFDLIIGSSRVAREHSDLAKRFIALEATMSAVESPSSKWCAEFEARRLSIEADERPIMRTLDVLCHNELAHALGHGEEATYRIGWIKRRLAQFVDFDTGGLRMVSEAKRR